MPDDDEDADIARMIARRRNIERLGISYYETNRSGGRRAYLTAEERRRRVRVRVNAYRARKREERRSA